jgi:hypothetical protein
LPHLRICCDCGFCFFSLNSSKLAVSVYSCHMYLFVLTEHIQYVHINSDSCTSSIYNGCFSWYPCLVSCAGFMYLLIHLSVLYPRCYSRSQSAVRCAGPNSTVSSRPVSIVEFQPG